MTVIYYLGLTITGVYFLLESRFKKSLTEDTKLSKRKYLIANCILYIILLFLLSANRTGFDSRAYQRFFNSVYSWNTPIYDYTYFIFGKIIYVSKLLYADITYFEFQLIVCLLLGIIIKKKLNPYIFSFRIFSFFYLLSGTIAMDGMQFKNFIAVLFFLIATSYLVKENNNIKNSILYIIFVSISALFHFAFIIYLVLIVFKWWKYERVEKIGKVLVILGSFLFCCLYVFPVLLPKIVTTLSIIPILKKLSKYSLSFTGKSAFIPFFLYFIQLLFLKICVQKKADMPEKLDRFNRMVWIINLLMGIFLPGLLYANAAFRLFRNIYILNFIVYSNRIVRLARLSNERMIYSIIGIAICLIILIYPNILLNQSVDIMDAMLNGKYFWIK